MLPNIQALLIRGLGKTYLNFGGTWMYFVCIFTYVTCVGKKIPQISFASLFVFHFVGKFHNQIKCRSFVCI